MVIAALVSFVILLIAWMVAPDGAREPAAVDEPMREAQPLAA